MPLYRYIPYSSIAGIMLLNSLDRPGPSGLAWSELDDPIWIKTGPEPEDIIEGGEEWFGFIFGILH